MKAKKTLKRLAKVEELLSNVIQRYAGSQHPIRELLDSAKASVVSAKEAVNVQAVAAVASAKRVFGAGTRERMAAAQRKRWSDHKKAKQSPAKKRTMSAGARKRIADAAKKRWAEFRAQKAASAKAAVKPATKKAAPKKRAAKAKRAKTTGIEQLTVGA